MSEYIIYSVAYVCIGLFANFMSGFCSPQAQNASKVWENYFVATFWPLYIVQLSGAFGAAIRMGWK